MTTLTMKEEKRLEVLQRVFRDELTVEEAAGDLVGRQTYFSLHLYWPAYQDRVFWNPAVGLS
jgi:hypothetical protein